jgi:hypothetical protein
MSDKNFGVKQINIISGSGTPTITSPNNLNLNAVNVAISTNLSVGGEVVSNLIVGVGYSVGIGTTNVTGRLQVGSATTNTNEFIITNAGDVGIGTSIPDHFDGFSSLTLDGKSYQNGPLTQYGGGNISLKSRGNNAFNIYSYSTVNGISTATNIDLYHDLYFLGSTGTNLLTVTESGEVGIGTTNPTSKLTVHGGDISVGVNTDHGVVLTSPNGTSYRLIVDDSGNLSTVSV